MIQNETNSGYQERHPSEAMYMHAPMGILVVNGNNKIESVNSFALHLFGYDREKLIDKDIKNFLPGFQPGTNIRNQASYQSNFPEYLHHSKYHSSIIKKNGLLIPVLVNQGEYQLWGSIYKTLFISEYSGRENHLTINTEKPNREQPGSTGYLNNITDPSKHRREALSLQQRLVDTTGAMITVTDSNGIITLFNQEASLRLDFDPAEVIGKQTPLLFHSKENIEKRRRELFSSYGINLRNDFDVLVEKANRNIHDEELCMYVRKDGEPIPVSLTIDALRDSKGTITGYIGVAIDISGRVKAEKELIRTRRLFLQLLSNYPDGSISIIDKNYRFVFIGGQLHKLLQVEAISLIGGEIFPNFEEPLRKIVREKLEEVFREKKHITDFELSFPIRHQTYIMDAFPLIEPDGSVNNVGVIIKNISKLKKAEESLIEALNKEKNLGELKSRFVSMASHEFRTPLSTILSSAYLIEKYKTSDDQPRREVHLKRITSSVNMMTDTLNEFLNIGRIEEGKTLVRFSEFEINILIQDLIEEFKLSLRKNQEFLYHHTGEPIVKLDRSLIKHIIINLISNASKFSPQHSTIIIVTETRKEKIILSVKDEGMGISDDDQKHLMSRFFRGVNATNIQGTGLGLYIVSKYVEMMGGTITCKSELDQGTEFIISFKIPES